VYGTDHNQIRRDTSVNGILPRQGKRRSLGDVAYSSLREALIHATLAPGEAITEEKLAADLEVSRPVVREAVQRLVAEGLVERQGNGRMRVRPATAADVRAHYAVRSVLEQLTVEEASRHMTPEGLDRLERALDRMRQARDRKGAGSVTEGGGDFHGILRDIAANPVNAELMEMIRARIDRYRHLSVAATAERSQHSVREHEEIFLALRADDIEAAKAAMGRHIMASRDSALRTLHEPGFSPDRESGQAAANETE
jgi:DNA-binding GntR family transcriptional regulator